MRIRLALALALAALVTAGCSGSQFGAAAVVGEERISLSTVEQSVVGLFDSRRSFGELDSGTVRSGEDARNALRLHINMSIIRQLAQERGLTISEGELRALQQQFIASAGGADQLRLLLTQNGIAPGDLGAYLEFYLYNVKLAEVLVPGDGEQVQAARNAAIQAEISKFFANERVTVNPRFGVLDPSTGFLLQRDDTNGVVLLPSA